MSLFVIFVQEEFLMKSSHIGMLTG